MTKLEYCLIENQYSRDREIIVCITRKGEIELDRSITEELSFKRVAEVLNRYGFVSLEKLWFECYKEEKIDRDQLSKDLYDIGVDHSNELKSHLNDMLELSNSLDEGSALQDTGDAEYFETPIYTIETDSEFVDTTDYGGFFEDPKKMKPKNNYDLSRNNLISYKVPENNEEISFCFHFFLDAKLSSNGEYYFEFRGDFFNEIGNESSNYINHVKVDFRRVIYEKSSAQTKIIFQSLKTFKEVMEDVDCLFSTKYKFYKELKNSKGNLVKGTMDLDFNVLEIKDCIDKDAHIVFETSMVDFQDLCVVSDRLEREIKEEESELMPVLFLQKAVDELHEKINTKRVEAAKSEDYEEASRCKEVLDVVEEKKEMIYSYPEEEMPMKDYFNNFRIGKF